MPRSQIPALAIGACLLTGLLAGSASAKDEKDNGKDAPRGQVQQQIQQRAQEQPRPREQPKPPTSQPRSSGQSGSPGGGSLRQQLQQQTPQPQPRIQQPSQPQTPRALPQSQGQGGSRNLPDLRGSQSNPPSLRDRLPSGGQNLPNQPSSDQQLRNRLQQQADDLRKQPGRTTPPGGQLDRDALKGRIEALKPQPGTADPSRDRLKDAQDQLKGRTGDLRDRPPTQPDRLPDQARDRLRDAQDQLKGRTGDRLPTQPDQARDRLQDQLKGRTGDRLPTQPDPARDRLRDAQDQLKGRTGDLRDRTPTQSGRLTDQTRDRLQDVEKQLRDRERRDGVDVGRAGQKATPLRIDKNGVFTNLKDHPDLKNVLDRDNIRRPEDLHNAFDKLQNSRELQARLRESNLRVTDLSGAFQTRLRRNDVDIQRISNTNIGRQININQQFNLAVHGDVARQLNLHQTIIRSGGWSRRPYVGPIYSGYTQAAFSSWYAGPGFYPAYAWTPVWSPWVSWTWWNYCLPIYDPRPFVVRPIYWYDPCPPIVVYDYPQWQPLPVVTSGTWVDVPPAIVDTGFDLQLLAVRFVDPGHKEEDYGPRYRIWLRNNSRAAIGGPFNVTIVAANGPELEGELPQAGVTVPEMDADTVIPVDVRLPFDANRMNITAQGQRTPFTHLHVLVDSHRDLQEDDESNNGAILDRQEILPVDPAAFSTDVTAAAPGSLVSLAGEGFGPEPGELLVMVEGQALPAEIYGWYDLGVNFKLPELNVGRATPIELLVVRGDGAASNPVTISLTPEQLLGEAPLPPEPVE
jgi:hypothetical protein